MTIHLLFFREPIYLDLSILELLGEFSYLCNFLCFLVFEYVYLGLKALVGIFSI